MLRAFDRYLDCGILRHGCALACCENVLQSQPHRRLVFSLPKRLRIYFKFDRKLSALLYLAAWDTRRENIDAVIPGAQPGAVMALHTAGSLLNWCPHIHGIFLDGGILPDGSFVQLPEVDTALIEEFFAEKVFAFLLDAEFIDQETIERHGLEIVRNQLLMNFPERLTPEFIKNS